MVITILIQVYFCIEIKTLLDYINEVSPKSLVDRTEGIEYSIYNYFIKNNIKFDTRNKMELIWYDYYTKQSYNY